MFKHCPQCGAVVFRRGRRGPMPVYCRSECRRKAGSLSHAKRYAEATQAAREERTRKREAHRKSICGWCGDSFVRPTRAKRKCCSDVCRAKMKHVRLGRVPNPLLSCRQCGKEYRPKDRRRNMYCSRDCYFASLGRGKANREGCKAERRGGLSDGPHRRTARRLGVAHEAIIPMQIFERDGWMCKLCGKPVMEELEHPNPRSASLDHIIPMLMGGTHTKDNVQCAHLGCNMSKGCRSSAQQLRAIG